MTISNWANVSDFLAMGGYGPYVWGSFGMAAAAMAGECWALRSRRRALQPLAAPGFDPEPGGAARPGHDFVTIAHEA